MSEEVLRTYVERLQSEDRLTWQALLRNEPVRLSDLTEQAGQVGASTAEVTKTLGAQHAVALPLGAPVLDGYPGVAMLYRAGDQADFDAAEVSAFQSAIASFQAELTQARGEHPTCPINSAAVPQRPPVSVVIFDTQLQPRTPAETWSRLDEALRSQMLEQARRQSQLINGHETVFDRVNLVDSHGDQWAFNRVTFKRYPALGEGIVTFFCLQPDCGDWSSVEAADLAADPELSRLMPAVKFMHAEYSRGPTLAEIAQQVKLSPFHFHRRFSELLGTTPKQYMLNCQIQKAKAELLAGTVLAKIAKDCGFAHQSHFTSRFKQATGLTPTRWRRMALRREQASQNN